MSDTQLECSNCGGKIEVMELMTPPGTCISEKFVRLCTYCAGSSAGNAYFYPRQHDGGASILCGMAAMMNRLEERLTKK